MLLQKTGCISVVFLFFLSASHSGTADCFCRKDNSASISEPRGQLYKEGVLAIVSSSNPENRGSYNIANIMALWIESVALLLCLLVCLAHGQGVDLTLQRGANGTEVVRSVESKLSSTSLFYNLITPNEKEVYEQFVREMAYVESKNGGEESVQNGGIWRVSRSMFELTQNANFIMDEVFVGICDAFCIDWQEVPYDELDKPLYSGLAVNIYLHHLYNMTGTTQRRLLVTDTDREKANFWVQSFGETRSFLQWSSKVQKHRDLEGMHVAS